MEKQINVRMNAETREKIDWLTSVLDENISSIIKRLVLEEYAKQREVHSQDIQFVRWIRSQKQG